MPYICIDQYMYYFILHQHYLCSSPRIKEQKQSIILKVRKSTAPCKLLMLWLFFSPRWFREEIHKVADWLICSRVPDHLTSSGQQVLHACFHALTCRCLPLATGSALGGDHRKATRDHNTMKGSAFILSHLTIGPQQRSTPTIVILLTWNNPGTCLTYGCHMSSHPVLRWGNIHMLRFWIKYFVSSYFKNNTKCLGGLNSKTSCYMRGNNNAALLFWRPVLRRASGFSYSSRTTLWLPRLVWSFRTTNPKIGKEKMFKLSSKNTHSVMTLFRNCSLVHVFAGWKDGMATKAPVHWAWE